MYYPAEPCLPSFASKLIFSPNTTTMMKHILVTGADGLLGSNLVRELVRRNYQVRAFVLPDSPSKSLEGLPVEFCYGCILNPDSLEKAMKGMEGVIHAAACTQCWPTRSRKIMDVNLEGTRHLIQVCSKATISKLVFISSASAFGFGSKSKPGDESTPFVGNKYGMDYIDSKYKAQQELLEAVKKNRLPATVINPTFMLGPFDSKPLGGRLILEMHRGGLCLCPPGGKNFVFVKDVATAIANALERGKIGECYITGHENLTYRVAFSRIAKALVLPPPKLEMPAPLIKLAGRAGSFVASIRGKRPLLSFPMAKISCDFQFFSSEKAVRELDMPQTPIEVAAREAFDWFKMNNYC